MTNTLLDIIIVLLLLGFVLFLFGVYKALSISYKRSLFKKKLQEYNDGLQRFDSSAFDSSEFSSYYSLLGKSSKSIVKGEILVESSN